MQPAPIEQAIRTAALSAMMLDTTITIAMPLQSANAMLLTAPDHDKSNADA